MEGIWEQVRAFILTEKALDVVLALLKLALGLVVARFASRSITGLVARQASPHYMMLLRRVVFYSIFGVFAASAMVQLGFKLSVLLGAAGILTVALGFASQTSASNVISGLFLLGEKTFTIGDVIRLGDITGEVLSIDLLSVKLRTFDNLFIRIPNEEMIKSRITNLSRFPIRRLDVQVGVAYKEDIDRVKEVLMAVADREPLCLEEPAPVIMFLGFGESSLNFQFSVWAGLSNFLQVRNRIQQQIKEAFDEAGIEIPFPHRSLYAGSTSAPFPIRIVQEDPLPPARA